MRGRIPDIVRRFIDFGGVAEGCPLMRGYWECLEACAR